MSGQDILKTLRTVSLRKVEVAGLQIHVRGLTGAERRLLTERARDGNPMQAYELAGFACCTESGDRLFSEEEAQALADVDGASVEKLAEAVLKASGLLSDAQEEAAKN